MEKELLQSKNALLTEKSKLERELMRIDNELDSIRRNENDEIKRKNNVKNKTKLSQLTSDDSVFKISYNFLKKEVYWTGYVDVEYCEYDKEFNYYKFSVSHKTKPEGFSTRFPMKYGDKHCVLLDFTSSLYFITMRPEAWEEDLKDSMKEYLATKKEKYNNEVKSFKGHIKEMSKSYSNLLKK